MHCCGISSKDLVLMEKNQYTEQCVCMFIYLNMYVWTHYAHIFTEWIISGRLHKKLVTGKRLGLTFNFLFF